MGNAGTIRWVSQPRRAPAIDARGGRGRVAARARGGGCAYRRRRACHPRLRIPALSVRAGLSTAVWEHVRARAVWRLSRDAAAGAPREPSALAQPFPDLAHLAAPMVMLLTLGVAFTAEVFLLGGDWATGALAAALAALALAAVTVIVLIVRVIAGRRALGTVALSALLALALVGGGVAGISQLNPLRRAQAQQFESAGQWQTAIDEYAQSGEKAPNAPDIARIYTEWGESLASGGDYAGATSKLTTVTQSYATERRDRDAREG